MENVKFVSPDCSSVTVPLDKLVLNEHSCSVKGTSYLIKAMGDLETDPYQATFIAETTEDNFKKHKENYPMAHLTITSSD